MIEVRQTETYAGWFKRLRDENAKARINVRIRRLSLGNLGDVKAVGDGVRELRIDYGPGYRVYFVQRGETWSSCCVAATRGLRRRTSEQRSIWRKPSRAISVQMDRAHRVVPFPSTDGRDSI
jgi:putative addiction module killer protein